MDEKELKKLISKYLKDLETFEKLTEKYYKGEKPLTKREFVKWNDLREELCTSDSVLLSYSMMKALAQFQPEVTKNVQA